MAFDGHDDKYRGLAEAFEDHIFVVNRDLCLEYVNTAAAQQFGVPPDKMIGTRLEDWFPPDVTAHQKPALARVFETGQSVYSEDTFTFGSRRVWLSTRLVPVKADGQTVTAVLGLSRDISERRHLEEQLRESQKMEAVGRLAGGVAHDFNNLLTAILGYLELVRRRLPSDSDLGDDLQEITTAARRAAELTRQLLAFGRRQALRPETLDLNGRIKNIEKMLRRLIGEDVEIVLRLAEGLWVTRVDPVQVDQVVLNLALNARDAMPDGGRLTIGTANVGPGGETPADSRLRSGRFVELAISDTGAGMNAATRERLFEPFFTTKEHGRGTGLGLATVYGIIKQSGGHINVESRLGAGTTFRIWLPQVDSPATATVPAVEPEVVTGKGETVLIVEDEVAVRSLVRKTLTRLGYDVIEARDGERALALAATHEGQIAALLTDVVMPGMTGPDLATALAATRPSIRVVYMSGYTDKVDTTPGLLHPHAHLLTKPFTTRDLGAAVRRAIDE